MIRIILFEGLKFIQILDDIYVEVNGSQIIMKVIKVSDKEVVFESSVYVRYGMLVRDYFVMMEKVFERVEVKYNVEEKMGSICGLVFFVGFVVVFFFFRRRK